MPAHKLNNNPTFSVNPIPNFVNWSRAFGSYKYLMYYLSVMPSPEADLQKVGGFTGKASNKESLTLSDAFTLGQAVEYLRQGSINGYEVGEANGDKIFGVLEEVKIILQSREIDSPVSGKVSQFLTDIESEYGSPDEKLDSKNAEELERQATTWANLLQQDLKKERRLPVAETGMMDAQELLESPESMFSKPVWNWLHQRPKSDIQEACRSVVVDSPTASVMLSLRAAEHCLREWHEDQTGNELEAAWGRVLDRLIHEYVDDSEEMSPQEQLSSLPPVLSNLYYLKEKRNEVNHPEKSPDNSEARRTLMLVAGTISDIFDETVEEIHAIYQDKEVVIPKEGLSDTEKVLKIVRTLDEGNGAQYSEIYEFAEEIGLSQYDTNDAKEEILMSGQAYEPEDGVLKPI